MSRNQSESWGTLKCEHCNKSVSLAGIMNLKVFCRGEKPWEPYQGQNWVPTHERCMNGHSRTVMQVAMVTSNSIYYASSQSSLYVPLSWTSQGGVKLQGDAYEYLEELKKKYSRKLRNNPELTKEDFIHSIGYLVNAAYEDDYTIDDNEALAITNEFLGISNEVDVVKTYRLEEFKVFVNNDKTPEADAKFEFNDINISEFRSKQLVDKFLKIKQVPMLAVTSTQLGFGRLRCHLLNWSMDKLFTTTSRYVLFILVISMMSKYSLQTRFMERDCSLHLILTLLSHGAILITLRITIKQLLKVVAWANSLQVRWKYMEELNSISCIHFLTS